MPAKKIKHSSVCGWGEAEEEVTEWKNEMPHFYLEQNLWMTHVWNTHLSN